MLPPDFEPHGHVTPRPDGVVARCGGPALCSQCRFEAVDLYGPEPDIANRAAWVNWWSTVTNTTVEAASRARLKKLHPHKAGITRQPRHSYTLSDGSRLYGSQKAIEALSRALAQRRGTK